MGMRLMMSNASDAISSTSNPNNHPTTTPPVASCTPPNTDPVTSCPSIEVSMRSSVTWAVVKAVRRLEGEDNASNQLIVRRINRLHRPNTFTPQKVEEALRWLVGKQVLASYKINGVKRYKLLHRSSGRRERHHRERPLAEENGAEAAADGRRESGRGRSK